MNAPDEPLWHCLPHDPLRFFDLNADDDVRTLKRAYNRLLRRFKPEKFPAEFQRIREAYEQLSEQLRYGGAAATKGSISVNMQDTESSTPAFQQDTPTAEVQDLDALLNALDQVLSEQKSVRDLQTELLHRDRRAPRDFIALAVLSDMLPPDASPDADEPPFVHWLIEGLRKHRDEPGLCELLREYLAGELPPRQRTQVLMQAAEVLSSSRFFLLTERVWDQLLGQVPFDQFKQTLAACQQTQGLANTGRLVFYVHLLRAAVWKADADWVGEIRAELEDSFFQLPPWTQYEIEYLDALITYTHTRNRFAKLSDTARKIDQAIETYYSAAESEGDWAVLECQYAIAERGLFLAGDFPLEDELDGVRDNLLLVWQMITNEVDDRLGAESLDLQPETLTEPVQQLMVRMHKRASKTKQHSFGNMLLFAGLGTMLVALVAMVCYLIRSVMDVMNVGIGAALVDLALALLAVVLGAIVGLVLAVIGVKRVALRYGDVRLELLNLFRIQPLTVSEMADVVTATEDTTLDGQSISNTDVVARGMGDDLAANFFSRALRTLAASEE